MTTPAAEPDPDAAPEAAGAARKGAGQRDHGEAERQDGRGEEADDAQPQDDSEQLTLDISELLRLWDESARGRQSLRGIRANAGTIGMGDQAITVGGPVGAIYYGAGPHAGRRVWTDQSAELGELRAALVEAPLPDGGTSRSRLVELLGKHTTVILAGAAGSGRESLALCALADALPAGSRVAVFLGNELSQLDASDFEAGAGYVINAAAPSLQRDLDRFVQTVSGFAEKQGARVVLIADDGTAQRWAGSLEVVRHQAPEFRAVFDALLVRRHHVSGDQVTNLLDPLLDAVAKRSLTEVATVARLVAQALADGRAPEAELDEHMRRVVLDRLREPLERAAAEQPARETSIRLFRRAFLIALAVGNDLPLDVITSTAIDFAGQLAGRAPGPRRWSLHFEPTDDLLDWASAHRVEGVEDEDDRRDGDDDSPGRVSFRYPNMPAIVLDAVWHAHHLARDALLNWLSELAVKRVPGVWAEPVRLRAAQAVGHLATHDFDQILADVVEPWIARSLSGQRAAARAAEAMIDNPAIADRAWEQVRRWSGGGREHRMAALFVYGAGLAKDRVPEALDLARTVAGLGAGVLTKAGTRRGWARAEHHAVASVLHSAATAGCVAEVVEILTGWLADLDEIRAQLENMAMRGRLDGRGPSLIPGHAAYCWLLLVGDGRAHGSRGPLLAYVAADAARWDLFERLWRLALITPGAAPNAWRFLRSWIEECADDRFQARFAGELLNRLESDRRMSCQLSFYAGLWVRDWARTGQSIRAREIVSNVLGRKDDGR
jgi:hypothetical protein